MRHYKHAIFITVALVFLSVSVINAYETIGMIWSTSSVTYDAHALPTANWKSAVWNGAVQWNNVTTSSFEWVPQLSGQNDVYLDTIDGQYGVYASTIVIPDPNNQSVIDRMTVKFDSGENWVTGTTVPASDQLDAMGMAAHELGHGLGLDHPWNGYCLFEPRPTMCQSYSYGWTYYRDLVDDDKDGVSDLYP